MSESQNTPEVNGNRPVRGHANKTVNLYMNRKFVCCEPGDITAKAARLIISNNLSAIVISSNEQPIAMLTTIELLTFAYQETFDPARNFLKTAIEDIIQESNMVLIPSGTGVNECKKIMIKNKIQAAPIVENNKVIGVLDLFDILRAINE